MARGLHQKSPLNHCFLPNRYVGELISDAEADVREDDSYLFDLDNKVSERSQPLNPSQRMETWGGSTADPIEPG